MAMMMFVDKKQNANDLKRLRKSICETMRTEEFNKLCVTRLGYAPSPWEIEATKASKMAVGEPWVSKCMPRTNRKNWNI